MAQRLTSVLRRPRACGPARSAREQLSLEGRGHAQHRRAGHQHRASSADCSLVCAAPLAAHSGGNIKEVYREGDALRVELPPKAIRAPCCRSGRATATPRQRSCGCCRRPAPSSSSTARRARQSAMQALPLVLARPLIAVLRCCIGIRRSAAGGHPAALTRCAQADAPVTAAAEISPAKTRPCAAPGTALRRWATQPPSRLDSCRYGQGSRRRDVATPNPIVSPSTSRHTRGSLPAADGATAEPELQKLRTASAGIARAQPVAAVPSRRAAWHTTRTRVNRALRCNAAELRRNIRDRRLESAPEQRMFVEADSSGTLT